MAFIDTAVGTPLFLAPEAVKKKPLNRMSDASNWSRLKHGAAEHRSYSRRRLCAMRWDAAPDPHWLSKCTSAVLPAGGPIALLTGDGSMPGARMQIFSGAGDLLSAWEWDFGRVRALGWTSAVELACVLEGGRVMLLISDAGLYPGKLFEAPEEYCQLREASSAQCFGHR